MSTTRQENIIKRRKRKERALQSLDYRANGKGRLSCVGCRFFKPDCQKCRKVS